MGQKAEYKSAARSRRLLREAYVQLMAEKPPERITVTDIVGRAGLNRGTFYAHYKNPAALRGQMEDELVERLFGLLNKVPYEQLLRNPLPLFLDLARFLERDREQYRQLVLSRESGPFLRQVRELFIQRLMRDGMGLPPGDREALAVQIRFGAGGIISIIQDWFEGRTDRSLEEMLRMLTPSVVGGMAQFLPDGQGKGTKGERL